jgi:hypothetical protein
MTVPADSYFGNFERSHLVRTLVRAVVSAVLLIALYYVVPIEHRAHQSVALRLSVALIFFSVVLTVEVRQIPKHTNPMLRAGVAMATIIPLFLVLFAWIYLTMSASSPAAFGGELNRTGALYFTVTVFSTVGFGDIAPKTDPARIVAMVQMLADLAVLAVVVRLILGAATRGMARLRTPDETSMGLTQEGLQE